MTPREGSPIVLPVETPLLDLATAVPVNGGIVLILSSGYTTFKAIKVSSNGALLSPLSPVAGPLVSVPVVGAASSGDTVLLFWGENLFSGQPVLGRRLDASAAWIDAAPFEIRPAGATIGGGYRTGGVVWNGSSFLCYWAGTSTGTIRVQPVVRRIAADGTPVDPQPVTLSGTSALTTAPIASFGFAWTGDRYLAPLVRVVYTRLDGTGPLDVPSGILGRTV